MKGAHFGDEFVRLVFPAPTPRALAFASSTGVGLTDASVVR